MDKIIGNCSKHPGHNFVNCPLCEIERQKKLSKNFWDNVQKDVERVNPTPEVTAEAVQTSILKDFTLKFFFWWYNQPGTNSYEGFDSFLETIEGKQALSEYASLVSASKAEEIARLKEDVKELVECLDLIVGSMSLERVERFELNEKAKSLIQKHEQ